MKKLSFLALAAVGLLFGACSSDKDVVVDENVWNGDGDGYMAISIKLPTTPSASRAANDVYDDGLAAEYNVQDAALLLFTGASESAATLMSAQPLTLPFPETDEDDTETPADNITTSYQAVAKVSGTVNGNLYALVVLNYKNVLNVASGTATIVKTGTTVTNLASIQSTADDIVPGNETFTNKSTNATANYFFMTNALLQNLGSEHISSEQKSTTAAPAAANIQTLAIVDANKIYRTEAEAKSNPAADVYVERAVAKATLSTASTNMTIDDNIDSQTDLKVTVLSWAIDNIEPKSFIVRNPGDNAYIAYSSEAFGTDNVYRFVGDKAMGITATLHNYYVPVYRHYWAIDPYYDVNYNERTADELLPASKYVSVTTPLYCNENTFDVDHQTYGNTTRAVIKCETDGGTFYTVNGGQTRYGEAAAKSYLVTDLVENADFQNKIKSCLKPDQSYTFSASTITPTYEVDASTAQVTIASIVLGSDISTSKFYMKETDIPSGAPAGTKAIEQLDFSDEIESANTNFKVLKYTNGIVYYEARFEHFANTYYEKTATSPTAAGALAAGDLAPWNFWEPTNKPSGTVAYPDNTQSAEENYLGRWGMVRNNWYDVTIGAFKKLGSPVDPTGKVDNPGTPDDNVEDYISIKIHVLSWAKRTQQWIL